MLLAACSFTPGMLGTSGGDAQTGVFGPRPADQKRQVDQFFVQVGREAGSAVFAQR